MLIRPITPDDVDTFREMRTEAVRLHPLAFTADLGETESRGAEAWHELAARNDGAGREVIMLADAGGLGLAGMTGVYTLKQPKIAHVGHVWGVYVRESFRRQGLAQSLLRACIAWAREKGMITLKLSVIAGNEPARRCYEHCGFIPYGTEPAAVQWDGRLHDELLMSLRLRS